MNILGAAITGEIDEQVERFVSQRSFLALGLFIAKDVTQPSSEKRSKITQ